MYVPEMPMQLPKSRGLTKPRPVVCKACLGSVAEGASHCPGCKSEMPPIRSSEAA